MRFQIEPATVADVEAIKICGRDYFNQMDFGTEGNGYENKQVGHWLKMVLCNKSDFITLKAVLDGRIVGLCFVGIRSKHMWHTGEKQACELVWHGDPNLSPISRARIMAELMARMESEVIKRGIKWFHVGCSAKQEFDSVHRYLLRRGYRDTDIVMVKELQHV